jgi:hypothetical protein
MILSPEHSNIAETTANLLEFILASYERLCEMKSASKSELDRHEQAIDSAFVRSGVNIRDYMAWAKSRLGVNAPKEPRVMIILRYCELGDDLTNACHRYFLVNRHKNKDAHRA